MEGVGTGPGPWLPQRTPRWFWVDFQGTRSLNESGKVAGLAQTIIPFTDQVPVVAKPSVHLHCTVLNCTGAVCWLHTPPQPHTRPRWVVLPKILFLVRFTYYTSSQHLASHHFSSFQHHPSTILRPKEQATTSISSPSSRSTDSCRVESRAYLTQSAMASSKVRCPHPRRVRSEPCPDPTLP